MTPERESASISGRRCQTANLEGIDAGGGPPGQLIGLASSIRPPADSSLVTLFHSTSWFRLSVFGGVLVGE